MSVSPDNISGRRFSIVYRGYDRKEVEDYLAEIAESYEAVVDHPEDAGAHRLPPVEKIGEDIKAVLDAATTSADEILRKARQQADSMVKAATEKASSVKDNASKLEKETKQRAFKQAQEATTKAETSAKQLKKDAERRRREILDDAEQQHQRLVAYREELYERTQSIKDLLELVNVEIKEGSARDAKSVDSEVDKVIDSKGPEPDDERVARGAPRSSTD